MNRDITKLIIHCAATPNGKPFTVRDIDAWHKERGFRRHELFVKQFNPDLHHIGYHGVIYLDGSYHSGRSEEEIGAHCSGYNADSIGICLIGTDKFTPKQWQTLREVVEANIANRKDITIHGHYEFNAGKSCPGFSVQEWLHGGMVAMKDHTLKEA